MPKSPTCSSPRPVPERERVFPMPLSRLPRSFLAPSSNWHPLVWPLPALMVVAWIWAVLGTLEAQAWAMALRVTVAINAIGTVKKSYSYTSKRDSLLGVGRPSWLTSFARTFGWFAWRRTASPSYRPVGSLRDRTFHEAGDKCRREGGRQCL